MLMRKMNYFLKKTAIFNYFFNFDQFIILSIKSLQMSFLKFKYLVYIIKKKTQIKIIIQNYIYYLELIKTKIYINYFWDFRTHFFNLYFQAVPYYII